MVLRATFTTLALAQAASLLLVYAADDLTMDVGDGRTVQSTTGTTVFLGTEYNPSKCPLQYESLQCNATNCGELNGYQLECAVDNDDDDDDAGQSVCSCSSADKEKCDDQAATSGTVAQSGDCSVNACINSYGYEDSDTKTAVCAERLHCVTQINTTSAQPAKVCHTCRSCLDQYEDNDPSERRFNCTAICPTEFLALRSRNASSTTPASTSATPVTTSANNSSSSSSTPQNSSSSSSTSTARSLPLVPALAASAVLIMSAMFSL